MAVDTLPRREYLLTVVHTVVCSSSRSGRVRTRQIWTGVSVADPDRVPAVSSRPEVLSKSARGAECWRSSEMRLKRFGVMATVPGLLFLAGCAGSASPTPAQTSPPAASSSQAAAPSEAPTASPSSAPSYMSGLVTAGVLTVATTGSAPPLTSVDNSGNLVGFWPDMTAEIAKRLGLTLKLIKIDFPGVLPGVAAHVFDLGDGGIFESPERLKSTTFIMSKPYLCVGLTAVVTQQSGLKTWADLKGKRLGGTTGEADYQTAQAYLKQNGWNPSTTVLFPGHPEAILGLTQNRIDAFAVEVDSALYSITQAPQGAQLTVIKPFLAPAPEGTAFTASEKDLATAVNGIITQMLSDGTINTLATKWFGGTDLVCSGS
jgi:ABC-type amino acid transport substrate-binding protein